MNKIVAIYLMLVTIHNAYGNEEIKSDYGVLVLTKENFKTAITDNKFILVEFYAPWCVYCKVLVPQYEKAAQMLSDQKSPIKLGKVDATEETELSEENGVKGYPTLKFYKNGLPIEYSGGHTADEIVAWLTKKTGSPAKELKTLAEVQEFIEVNNVAIIGFFKNQTTDESKIFLSVAGSIDDYPFAITSDKNVFKEYGANCGSIILFKKFDEKKSIFEGKFLEKNIKKFVTTESLPLVVEFNDETKQKIFKDDIKSYLLLFVSKRDAKTEKIVDAARSIAKPFKDQVLFVTIDTDEEDHQRFLEFFGMKKEETPAVRLIKLDEDEFKYKPASTELTKSVLESFVQDFLDGKLKQHLLSQTLPEDWNQESVRVLVASNFDNVTLDSTKDVLVEFYAPWCGQCTQLSPIYDQVGEHFEKNDDVVIAKMDATANELEHTRVKSFPTIKLYSKGDNKVIEYNGSWTVEGLTKFVETGGIEGAGVEEPIEEETEDDDTSRKDEL